MKEYLTCEYASSSGVSLQKARRFTEEEKNKFASWYREVGFVQTSDSVDLEYLTWLDVRSVLGESKKEDGSFPGCGNATYIITDAEWNRLIELNNDKKLAKEHAAKLAEIKECKEIIEACKRQGKLYTQEEAEDKARAYNNLYNESSYGYVPHYYTTEEYECAKMRLSELQS